MLNAIKYQIDSIRVYRFRIKDDVSLWIARHAPSRLVYWFTILAYSRAWHESGGKTPDELTFSEVVKPWEPSLKESN